MKKFIIKSILLILLIFGPLAFVNVKVDPAHLFDNSLVENAARELINGNTIESPGDFDEGLLQEIIFENMDKDTETFIIGSSHIMYIPWEYDDYYVAGLSGAYSGDYFAICGMLDANDMKPKKIVFGIDPWAFYSSYENGRHSSVSSYARYEYELAGGNSSAKLQKDKGQIKKLKELFSFSYFQSSIRNIKSRGLSYYLKNGANEINVVSSGTLSDASLIYPNGGRNLSKENYESVDSINNTVVSSIDKKNLYQLGDHFTVVDEKNFNDFVSLLEYLQKKGIEVEIYLAPWYPLLYDYFQSSEDFSGVITLEKMLRESGKELDITIHGSYNPYICQMTCEDYADWLHLKQERMLDSFNVIVE